MQFGCWTVIFNSGPNSGDCSNGGIHRETQSLFGNENATCHSHGCQWDKTWDYSGIWKCGILILLGNWTIDHVQDCGT